MAPAEKEESPRDRGRRAIAEKRDNQVKRGSHDGVQISSDVLGRAMFDAYNRAGPNPGLSWDGKPVPPWEACGDQVRGKWRAAAEEAVKQLCPKAIVVISFPKSSSG